MSNYGAQLEALGLSPELVRLHLQANEIQKARNLEHPNYGREYEREQMLDHPETFPSYADRRGA